MSMCASQFVSRKRRKQEFKKQSDEASVVSFNSNPLSNNSALAYSLASSRYLNENTNISNGSSSPKPASKSGLASIARPSAGAKLFKSALVVPDCEDTTSNSSSLSGSSEPAHLLIDEDEPGVVAATASSNSLDSFNESFLDDQTVQILSKGICRTNIQSFYQKLN